MYLITVFINTGLIQIQGTHKDTFIAKVLVIIDKVINFNTCQFDEHTDCSEITTYLKATKYKKIDNDVQTMVKHVDIDIEEKAVKHVDKISETIIPDNENHQPDTETSKSNESDKSIALYRSDKYMENIQAYFKNALEKNCTQQSKLIDDKLKAVEETYI
ncbi:unnamed protein product [Mytilus coruscus]|uniref:Uncharacterized protein n=1 Tax=Mytilus coruscus TaxID=42192 RepID=A0A6J8DZG6_MYTCO|nr:unnamed protein product [Mytilus coruscus]